MMDPMLISHPDLLSLYRSDARMAEGLREQAACVQIALTIRSTQRTPMSMLALCPQDRTSSLGSLRAVRADRCW